MDISTRSTNRDNEDFSDFWKVTSKNRSLPWSRIILQSFLAIQNLDSTVKMAPDTLADPFPSSLVSPKLTQTTLFYAHCVPQEGDRVGGGNQHVEGNLLTIG